MGVICPYPINENESNRAFFGVPMNLASFFLLKLDLLLILFTIIARLCIQFFVQALALEGVRVEGQGTLGDKCGHKDKNGEDGELHTGNILESF